MTSALYDQDLLDDPETPVFNQVLDLDCELINLLIDGEHQSPAHPDFLECAFEVPADEFDMANIHVPTVAEIEDDIDAGRVPLIEAKHRSNEDKEPEPEPQEEKQAAFASVANRDS